MEDDSEMDPYARMRALLNECPELFGRARISKPLTAPTKPEPGAVNKGKQKSARAATRSESGDSRRAGRGRKRNRGAR
jgi:hypothetical protein